MAKLEAAEMKLESSKVETKKKTVKTWQGEEIKYGFIHRVPS